MEVQSGRGVSSKRSYTPYTYFFIYYFFSRDKFLQAPTPVSSGLKSILLSAAGGMWLVKADYHTHFPESDPRKRHQKYIVSSLPYSLLVKGMVASGMWLVKADFYTHILEREI